jgi:hypothetical protein
MHRNIGVATTIRLDRSTAALATTYLPVCQTKTEESYRYREPLTDSQWQAIWHELHRQVHRLDQDQVQWLAEQIYQGLLWLDRPMTEYCSVTCPSCSDPCCSATSVFFNQADILYLTAQQHVPPPLGQTRTQASAPCRYLSPEGCLIARSQRPYVCVWFFCESQMEILNSAPTSFHRQLIQVVQHLRACRLQLESLYEEQFRRG